MQRLTLAVFFASICLGFFAWQYIENKEVSVCYYDVEGDVHCLKMPAKDRRELSLLMELLFAQGNFAYTVLGTKPLSWESYQNPFPLSSWEKFYDSFSQYNRGMRTGWNTWEKYRHLFPKINLWMESSTIYPGLHSIFIVNEKNFTKILNENQRDFRDILGRNVTGAQLLSEAKEKCLIDELLQGHQALIGIVLGYGRNNSWLFHSNCQRHQAGDWVWDSEESYFGSKSETGIEASSYYWLFRYSCPSFAGDPKSEESIALKNEYLATKQRLLKYYNDKDFLEATLSLLAGYQTDP